MENPVSQSDDEFPQLNLVEPFGEDADELGDGAFFTSCVGALGSFAFHLGMLLVLTLWVGSEPQKEGVEGIFLAGSVEPISQEEMEEIWEETTLDMEPTLVDETEQTPLEEIEEVTDVPNITLPTLLPNEQETMTEMPEGTQGDPLTEIDTVMAHAGGVTVARQAAELPDTGGYEGRSDGDLRGKLLREGGGNAQSEDAVLRGLRWLYAHQQADREQGKTWGCWTFDLARAPYCKCTHRGENSSSTGATAMAMLAMLGHGSTRQTGEFRQSIKQGLYYLSTRAIRRKGIPGLDLREGSMYSQMLATLAICEAHAMEGGGDKGLEALARGAVQWILWAQDPNSGGWRYQPREAGDVTVTTWAIMVLKSAKMAGIEIPSVTLVNLERFLNSVASADKTRYGYQVGKEPIRSTTAIGLAARIFTGAKKNEKYLQLGAETLQEWRHSGSDLYYDYYATLFLRHYGGNSWEQWNPDMRDYLIATQSLQGHEYGSWYFDEPEKTHNQTGGRLYTTALATMILEVYYRYMPVYQENAAGKMY